NEAACLSLQLLATSDPTTRAAISFAIWGVFVPQAITDYGPAAQSWLNSAMAHTHDTFSNVFIYTPDTSYPITCNGGLCEHTPPQEFIVVRPPEAPSFAFLALDLVAFAAVVLLFRRRSPQTAA